MKACGKLEVTAPRIINFGTRIRRIVSYTPTATLPAEKKAPRSTGWVRLRVASEAAAKLCPSWPWMHRGIGEVEVWFHSFLTSAIDGVKGQLHAPAALLSDKESPWQLNWRVSARDWVGLNAFEKKSISYPYRESKRDSSDGVDSVKETKSLSISKNQTQIFRRLNDRLVISWPKNQGKMPATYENTC
jgi:hypothetical protein